MKTTQEVSYRVTKEVSEFVGRQGNNGKQGNNGVHTEHQYDLASFIIRLINLRQWDRLKVFGKASSTYVQGTDDEVGDS